MKGRILRSVALALATVLTAGAFAATASAKPKLAADGSVNWGVYASWRNYILNGGGPMPPGTITTSGQATQDDDGTFSFPARRGYVDPENGELWLTLAGGVRFEKPAHGVDMRLSNLEAQIVPGDPDQSAIFARVRSVERTGPDSAGELKDYGRIRLVRLDPGEVTPQLAPPAVEWLAVPSALTEAAVPAFGGGYDAGTEFDLATIAAEAGAAPVKLRVKPRPRARVKGRTATVAKVSCNLGPCTILAPKRAQLRVGAKKFPVKVKASKRVDAGKPGQVKVALARRAAKKLAGRQGKVRFALEVDGPGTLGATGTVKTILKGGRR